MPPRKSATAAARAARPVEPEGALALLTVGDIDDIKDATRGVSTQLPRIEKVMREQLEVNREISRNTAVIAENTRVLPQLAADLATLLDVLVGKRTNGSTDLHAAIPAAEGTNEL